MQRLNVSKSILFVGALSVLAIACGQSQEDEPEPNGSSAALTNGGIQTGTFSSNAPIVVPETGGFASGSVWLPGGGSGSPTRSGEIWVTADVAGDCPEGMSIALDHGGVRAVLRRFSDDCGTKTHFEASTSAFDQTPPSGEWSLGIDGHGGEKVLGFSLRFSGSGGGSGDSNGPNPPFGYDECPDYIKHSCGEMNRGGVFSFGCCYSQGWYCGQRGQAGCR